MSLINSVIKNAVSSAVKTAASTAKTAAEEKKKSGSSGSGKTASAVASTSSEGVTSRFDRQLMNEADLAAPDLATLEAVCRRVLCDNAKAVQDYRGGKATAIKALIGGVMRETRGTADAKTVEDLLQRMIKER